MTERASAPAKLNLDLHVLGAERDGYHRLRSLAQAINYYDTLQAEPSDDDHLDVDGEPIPGKNLVWGAVESLRRRSGDRTPLHLSLDKRIPVAAGLGGGSADAAAALLLVGRILGVSDVADLAPLLGADVPFFLDGGLAMMEGRGERLTRLPLTSDYAVGVVTPTFHLATADVFRAWDRLGDAKVRPVHAGAVPPSLREYAPLINDLEPAARLVAPDLGDWISDLEDLWDRPVLLTGSGPALFAFFVDVDEARSAVASAPGRAAFAARPIPGGVRVEPRL
ncbi:MAG: 4-(cytidine 5'-diphospho)-2-C-methyl-D-erythritol kinase [Acidimicrobiia bacterium]